MDSEDRHEEVLTCKNVVMSMIDAVNDLLLVDDDLVDDAIDARYRIAIVTLDKEIESLKIELAACKGKGEWMPVD